MKFYSRIVFLNVILLNNQVLLEAMDVMKQGQVGVTVQDSEEFLQKFFNHSKFFPCGSQGCAGTSGMFPSSRTGTEERKS